MSPTSDTGDHKAIHLIHPNCDCVVSVVCWKELIVELGLDNLVFIRINIQMVDYNFASLYSKCKKIFDSSSGMFHLTFLLSFLILLTDSLEHEDSLDWLR